MKEKISISDATLKRLPQYLRILKEKQTQNIQCISSTAIAKDLQLNPIQVRKDLALVSQSKGKPGVGFEIGGLIRNIEESLGLNNSKEAILIGAGRLGQALLNYKGFENRLDIRVAVDSDKNTCDNKKIFHIKKMEDLIKKMNIHIAIITVPKEKAQNICDILVKNGIKAIWNFAPVNLKVPEDIVLKNEDLTTSISILLKKLEEKNRGGKLQ